MSKRALDHLRKDEVMAGLIERVGPLKLQPRRLPPFHALTHAIIHQQLSGKSAGAIMARFEALFDPQSFPTPQTILEATIEQLRSAGLSRPKIGYIHGMAKQAVEGFIPTLARCENMTDTELLELFTQIKGIGRWTVEMLLIFNLGRPDVLPVHDLGVRKGFQLAYRKRQLPKPEQLDRFGTRWAPYRTTAARYLWRAADFLNGNGW